MKFDLSPSNIGLNHVLAVALILMASEAKASIKPIRVSASEVRVRVKLFEPKSGQVLKDHSEVAVWLVPVLNFRRASQNTDLPHYRITQRDKMFEPRLLVVPVGSVVEFRNSDPWFHSAFSFSNRSRFDLGPQPPGAHKIVRFNRAGLAYVFCNLHPQMEAAVLAVNSPYFGVSDKAGRISIGNVPPGRYYLHVWYENAPARVLNPIRHSIVLENESHSIPTISISLVKRVPIVDDNLKHQYCMEE